MFQRFISPSSAPTREAPPNYFKTTSLEQRIIDFERVTKPFPEKYPVIVIGEDPQIQLDKIKFMVMKTMTFGEFAAHIRKRLQLTPDIALFYFVGRYKKCVHHSQTIGELANEYANPDDKFLAVYFRGESAFGSIK